MVDEPVVEEVPQEEDMVANITFSFNKKKPVMDSEERVTDTAPIPRQLERTPEEKHGMAIMNSEYDSGVLRHTEVEYDRPEGEVREILPKAQTNATEYYRGSEENDVPLKYRPAAPLAHARSSMNVEINERVDLNPEDDESNRPLAQRPPAPLARATEMGPSLEYLTEPPLDEEIHPMHSWVGRPEMGRYAGSEGDSFVGKAVEWEYRRVCFPEKPRQKLPVQRWAPCGIRGSGKTCCFCTA